MAKKKTLLDLLDDLVPGVAKAFRQSIADIKSDAQISLLIRAIEDRNVEQVIALLNLDAAYFEPLDKALRNAYAAGGGFTIEDVRKMGRAKGARIIARFDVMNPAAQEFMAMQSSRLVVEITNQARELVRERLTAAFADGGKSPRTVALDIVGRVNRVTGKREGGVIGLTSGDNAAVERAREELSSASKPAMRNFLKRAGVTERERVIVEAAIRDGRRVPAKHASKMIARYEAGLLKRRGERIARTELIEGLNRSADDAFEQMINAGKMPRDAIINTWDAANDGDTRDSHIAMDGDRAPQGEAFTTGAGYRLRFPGDRSLGAPAEEIINCRCMVRRDVDFTYMLRDDA
jgi:F like protein